MAKILLMILPVIAGSVIMVNGVTLKSDDMIASAKVAANQVNIHQFDNVLELYYLDHNQYPAVSGGEALSELLFEDGYIRNKPLDSSVIDYEPKSGNQDYYLGMKNNL